MKIVVIIARVLLGLVFVVFGMNIFLQFIKQPPMPPGPMKDFATALFVTHYIWAVGALQVVGGLLLLIGKYVPLGLTLLGPVIVNIDLTHLLMEPKGLPIAAVVSVLALVVLYGYRSAFAGLVKP